jgi:hypothetical protein
MLSVRRNGNRPARTRRPAWLTKRRALITTSAVTVAVATAIGNSTGIIAGITAGIATGVSVAAGLYTLMKN